MRMNRFLAAVISMALLVGCREAPGSPVRFRTPDGFTIVADVRLPEDPRSAAPLVVLGHELDRDRHSWDPLVPRLLQAGYAVATVDHRGFGESIAEGNAARSPEARAGLGLDLLGAIEAAGRLAGVDTSRVAAIGTGISVPAAGRCARENPSVRALVLLTGLLDVDDEDFLLAKPEFPVLLVAASGDARGVGLMRQYARRFTGPPQTYVELGPTSPDDPAEWRGTDGLTGDTGLADLLLWFLKQHLPPGR